MSEAVPDSAIQAGDRPAAQSNWWKHLLALVFGVTLLWLAFRGCDPEKIIEYSGNMDLRFVALTMISGVTANFLRAVRWIYLLKPVAGKRISLWHSFYAVFIGYAVNVAIPRGGEVARLVAISRLEKLPWAGVLPTMFIDRLLDVLMLVLFLAVTATVLPESLIDQFPRLDIGASKVSLLFLGGIALLAGTLLGLSLLPRAGTILRWIMSRGFVEQKLPEALKEKLAGLTEQFDQGARCLSNPRDFPLITLLTAAMWLFYWLNFYLMLFAFHLDKLVSVKDCLISFTMGTVGVLIPTPGSAGGFHFFVSQSLVVTSGIDKDQALAYATILHLIAFIVVTCIPAALAVGINGFLTRKRQA